ncbi:hypothetical protein ATK30_0193 [Amycolatopsis echigonensis]|uniref:Uncharacterized protein n=1 Tax=Amycolatopsis echigonensis TaxID=2576905 RepID=A0A2N3X1X9_9PSEU|nr:hypothetical protein ATK30_0193 [Amycolatopsis niigatensis]
MSNQLAHRIRDRSATTPEDAIAVLRDDEAELMHVAVAASGPLLCGGP